MVSPVAPIFDVQRFSIHDGPGIRTLVFFKGCNLRCDWCQNPESQQPAPVVAFYADRCRGDLECQAVCPESAIRPSGFRIDYQRCSACMRCVDACARDALRAVGERLTPERLLERLLPDLPYYRASGGGVTFSGGEPTLYPRFMARMLELCREHGIHTVLETCGSYSHERWAPLLRGLDLIYFDLKIIDTCRHFAATGFDSGRILANARRLTEEGFPVVFRMPLVPGYTDDDANLSAVARILHELGHYRLNVLPYHDLGEAKIDVIDGPQPKLGLGRYPPQRLEAVRRTLARHGIEALAED